MGKNTGKASGFTKGKKTRDEIVEHALRVAAVEGLRGGSVVLDDVFVWRRGAGFASTGRLPSIVQLLEERDERIDPRVFGALAAPAPTGRETAASQSAELRVSDAGPRQGTTGSALRWSGTLRRLGTILE